MTDSTLGYEVQEWSPAAARVGEEYWAYWNEESVEKGKSWYVLDRPVKEMEDYVAGQGLLDQLHQCLTYVEAQTARPLQGIGLDLAAGTLWSVPHLLKSGTVDRLFCVEYSEHRLLKVGPVVLQHYAVPREKVVLCLGSFYDLHIANESVDFILLSQALHHAERPDELLAEVVRVLKPGGTVLVIGEHVPQNYYKLLVRHMGRYILSHVLPGGAQRRLFGRRLRAPSLYPTRSELFPPDPVKGDRIFSDSEYRAMFSRQGFRFQRLKPIPGHEGIQSFVLGRDSSGPARS